MGCMCVNYLGMQHCSVRVVHTCCSMNIHIHIQVLRMNIHIHTSWHAQTLLLVYVLSVPVNKRSKAPNWSARLNRFVMP